MEPNAGFKDFVLDDGGLLLWYFSIHIQTSSLRRRDVRTHTVTVVVKNRATGSIVASLSVKADFGFIASRKASTVPSFLPMTSDGQALFAAQMQETPFLRAFRSLNFIDPDNLDARLRYFSPVSTGLYEEWICTLPCMGSPRRGELTVDVEDPATAARNMSTNIPLPLGRRTAAGFRRHVGVRRTLRMRNLVLSEGRCRRAYGNDFRLATQPSPGTFCTDPTGTRVQPCDLPTSVRQYMRPGFAGSITGKFHATGRNLGLYKRGARLFLDDVAHGLDPRRN